MTGAPVPSLPAVRRRKGRFDPARTNRFWLLASVAVLVYGAAQVLSPARGALIGAGQAGDRPVVGGHQAGHVAGRRPDGDRR